MIKIAFMVGVLHFAFMCGHSLADERFDLISKSDKDWKSLEKFYLRLKGEGRYVSVREYDISFKLKDGQILGVRSKEKSKKSAGLGTYYRSIAGGVNQKYAFLAMSKDDKQWSSADLFFKKAEMESHKSKVGAEWLGFLQAPYASGGTSMHELFEHPGMKVLSVVDSNSGKGKIVVVTFKFDATDDEKRLKDNSRPLWALRGGSFSFYPDMKWCVAESELEVEPISGSRKTERTTIQYKGESEGFPLVESVERVYTPNPPGATIPTPSKFEIKSVIHIDVPDEEFMLSSFGIPEPGGNDQLAGESNWQMITFGCAIVAIAMVMFWSRFGRKS